MVADRNDARKFPRFGFPLDAPVISYH